MKRNILLFGLIAILFAMASCSGEQGQKSTEMVFKDGLTHDFGKIQEGSEGTYEFVFENKGENSLIIQNVKSSCGCTVPTYPKDPVEKGKTGIIKVKYNTKRIGAFTKHVTVYSNAKASPIQLNIKGEVLKKEE